VLSHPTVPAYPPPPHRGRGGGLLVLVLVTVLAALAAPHARQVRDQLAAGVLPLPQLRLPQLPQPAPPPGPGRAAPAPASSRAARAVAYALDQTGKPYQWGAEGPGAFDCSGLTWAAWRAAGVTTPRTAAGQLAGLPRARGKLRAGDLLIYRTDGPSRRHVAMVVDHRRMVEAPRAGVPVRVTGLRRGWLGAVRPGGR
jgi:NlpC/P60 family